MSKAGQKSYFRWLQNKSYAISYLSGADCVKPASCWRSDTPYPLGSTASTWNFSAYHTNFPSCSCASGKQTCPRGSYGPNPPMKKLNTKDTLIDLTGRNVSDYLMKSTDEYIKRRYYFKEMILPLTTIDNTPFERTAAIMEFFQILLY